MSELTVSTSSGSYEVLIGLNNLSSRLTQHSAVVIDPAVGGSIDEPIRRITFPAHESRKTLGGVEQILVEMNGLGLTRGSTIAAVGGGVIQDVATLAASLYMRGIPWTYAPTTMMAMLDSCIGGKSSINVAGIKNLVGNIYPPSSVIVDVSLAQTLPIEARIAGYAEAVKICFARGPETLDKFMKLVIPADDYGSPVAEAETLALTTHVLDAKKWFIENDEFDRRERLLLNFGHTFGHALEAALNFSIPHGIAIAIGMAAALKFSPNGDQQSVDLEEYIASLAKQLPAEFQERLLKPDWERFTKALVSDKKGSPTHLRFVLASAGNSLEIIEFERNRGTVEKAREVATIALEEFASRCGASP